MYVMRMEPNGHSAAFGQAGAVLLTLNLIVLALAAAPARATLDEPRSAGGGFVSRSGQDSNQPPRIVTGRPEFTSQVIAVGIDLTHAVRAADFDADGDIDAVSADCGPSGPYCAAGGGGVFWFENDGAGNFATRTIDNALDGAYPVDVADVDQDGDWDVLATGYIAHTVAWYENNGIGGFSKHVIDAAANGAHSVVSGDVDGDGDNDLVTTNQDGNQVVWYENQGPKGFGPAVMSDDDARMSHGPRPPLPR
jgi:hypothetical protein